MAFKSFSQRELLCLITLAGGEYIIDHANTAAWSNPKEDYVKVNCDGSVVDFGIKAYTVVVCVLRMNLVFGFSMALDSYSIIVVVLR